MIGIDILIDGPVGHYRMHIISSVGHPMSDSVGLLVIDGNIQ